MSNIANILYLFIAVFGVLTFLFNAYKSFPRLPWDIWIDKSGVRFCLPFITSLVISGFLTLLFNFFRK
ncbi:MAG: DUF2905 family protein [bacterium]|nr:DUF2905 family protein [bacterium]